ncbi:MAG: DnaB-like helicase C-terminal domain-containing protein [Pseudobdellovibrio sp.]
MGLDIIKLMLSQQDKGSFHKYLKDRNTLSNDILKTNISVIDDAMKGIWPDDFVVVAAKSGSGKTELLSSLACNIALTNKKVLFFPLEAYKGEVHNRIHFTLYSTLYYEDTKMLDLSYGDFARHGVSEKLKPYQNQVEEQIEKIESYLSLRYREKSFNLKDFILLYKKAVADGYKLVIVDHAQFFNFDEDTQSENRFVKDMTLEMFDLINTNKVPIILASHIRKISDNKAFPTIDDIYGSSELAKKATRVLILCKDNFISETNSYGTIFRFEKNREDGTSDYKTVFNINTKKYSVNFQKGKIVNNKFQPV